MPTNRITKAARMVLLLRLREQGILDDMSLQDLGDAFGLNRSTIHRDLRELEIVKQEYERLMASKPWIRPDPTDSLREEGWVPAEELAEETGYSQAHLHRLAREERVAAQKVENHWWIHREALEDYIQRRHPSGRGKRRGPRAD